MFRQKGSVEEGASTACAAKKCSIGYYLRKASNKKKEKHKENRSTSPGVRGRNSEGNRLQEGGSHIKKKSKKKKKVRCHPPVKKEPISSGHKSRDHQGPREPSPPDPGVKKREKQFLPNPGFCHGTR